MNKEEQIIIKKEQKKSLSKKELLYFFDGYLKDTIDDQNMTRLLKAICKNNLSLQEIYDLTDIFIKSGDVLSLKGLSNVVDKHSTGGVGDKTTLIIAPIVACLNVKMPKMSGRGLGHTGGTIDKLESIKVNTSLTEEEFLKEVKEIGFAITGQTKNLCPMDKKVYALRDVTNTTSNIGLIAVSIMSKKIACGASNIVIDLKVGKGALINNLKAAKKLAHIMIKIGKKYHRKVVCVLTNMDNPLGNNIGNLIEIKEVLDFLQNKVHNNLYELCITLATEIVALGLNISLKEAKEKVQEVLKTGQAYDKFIEMVNYQQGNLSNLKLPKGYNVYASYDGYIKSIDALKLGEISMKLGAGRVKKEDKINKNAGIILNKNVNDYVKKGELLCTLYGKNKEKYDIEKSFLYTKTKPYPKSLIIGIIR